MVAAPYGARPLKRIRRTRNEIDRLKAVVITVLEEIQPATVRQTFYQLVSRGELSKTEQSYKGLGRLLVNMRRAGELPFSWLADNTRWMRKPASHESLGDLLHDTARLYRRSVWSDQEAYVEVWLEKDALSGVLMPVTARWDVPLMVTRGYPSLTFLHAAATEIASVRKPAFLYYLGDRDPSGVDIPRKVEADLRKFAPEAEIHFRRVAVTDDQVVTMGLPTRPTKRTDSRSHSFDGESVEVDAIPPDTLRSLVNELIEQHVDHRALATLRQAEASERQWLKRLAESIGN